MRLERSEEQEKVTPEQLISAYLAGFFPMAVGLDERIEWFMAEPRTILPLDDRFTVRRSLRKTMKRLDCQIRDVMRSVHGRDCLVCILRGEVEKPPSAVPLYTTMKGKIIS